MILPIAATIFVLSFVVSLLMFHTAPFWPSRGWHFVYNTIAMVVFLSGITATIAAIWRFLA